MGYQTEDTTVVKSTSCTFEAFYQSHFLKVKLSLTFMGVEEETAKDLTQEAFAKLWLHWSEIDHDLARRKFLRVVSKNLWIDRYRKIKRESSIDHTIEQGHQSVEEQLLFKDLLHATDRALDGYAEQQRNMYYDIKLNGESYKNVSEKFQVNIKTLERYMTKMSKSVKSYLLKHYPHLSALIIFLEL